MYNDEMIMFETNCCKSKVRKNKDKIKDDLLGILHGMFLGVIFSGIFILALI